MLALALLVCEWESTTSRDTWRHPKERDRRYLTALIGWGYKPSDVEQLILATAAPQPEQVKDSQAEQVKDSQAEQVKDGQAEQVEDGQAEQVEDGQAEQVEEAS